MKLTRTIFFREERKSFIRAKYLEKSYCTQYCATKLEVYSELEQAIATHNLTDLIQAASEAPGLGAELTDSLPDSVSFSFLFFRKVAQLLYIFFNMYVHCFFHTSS